MQKVTEMNHYFRRIRIIGVLLWALPVVAQAPPFINAPVGFVTHYHEGSLEELAGTPVTAELADLIHWRMVDLDEANPRVEAMRVDFSNAAGWLPLLRESGRRGWPIIDTALHHSSIPWRQEMTRRVNQNLIGADGRVWHFSSLHSPVFRESVFNYIEQFTAWFREHDSEGAVPGYLNGAEWFYPGSLDYSPMALAVFREWLQRKYASLTALNEAWGQEYAGWDEVAPPRPSVIGGYHVNEPTYALNSGADASYAFKAVPVTPGRRYRASATVSGSGAAMRYAGFHFAWLDGANKLITVAALHGEANGAGTFLLQGEVQAPPTATAVVFHCKLLAWGEAVFRNPELTDSVTGDMLTSRTPDDWTHHVYTGASTASSHAEGEDVLLALAATGGATLKGHVPLMLEDWTTFSFETMAHWLNDCAKHIRACDPNRAISSYVGFVFAQQAQWDYAMVNQRLDISLMNTPDIDVNGIQMCIAGNDYTWATNVVDTARKYGKPVRATDLIDFPYGLYSGFEAIYRGTLAAVQHGMTEVFWYGWKGVPDYSYLQRMSTSDRNRLITDTRKAIDALEGYHPFTNMAQLTPLMSYSLADDGGFKGDMIDNGGLYHLLLDAGFTVDVWTPYEIENNPDNPLERYDAVFMSDCPVLPRAVYERLLRFVERGGALISSGRLPEKDLRGNPFDQTLAGRERVVSLGESVGRRYWGRLRREQVYGNTPPVLVEAPDPERTEELRRILRATVAEAVATMNVPRVVSLSENPGAVHAVPFRNKDNHSMLLFLVHKGTGRCHHVDLRLEDVPPFSSAEAWCDFDVRQPCTLLDDSILRTPDFAHACMITLAP